MKDKYLEDLRERLEDCDATASEINDILEDYSEMLDDAIGKNMSEEEIYSLIGTPKQVVKELKDQLNKDDDDYDYENDKAYNHNKNKIVALMPFISVIIFFILGFVGGLWHPGWLVFLLIPMTAIIVNAFNRRFLEGLVALSPFIATISYLGIGFLTGIWHPTWLIFLIIPILGIFTGARKMTFLELLTALSPFIVSITYFLIGYIYGVWHPTWLLFLLIPIIGILNEKNIWKLLAMEFSIIAAAGIYLYIGYELGIWNYSAFVFLIPIGMAQLILENKPWHIDNENRYLFYITLILIVVYFVFGFTLDTWAYLWMIFLLVPMLAIFKNAKDKNMIVALMPFISVIIFFTLGYFFGWWEYSWIAFFLIPVTAIIKNA